MALKQLFFQKITKNCPAAGGIVPATPWPLAAGGSAPRSPSVMRLSYTSLLNITRKLDMWREGTDHV